MFFSSRRKTLTTAGLSLVLFASAIPPIAHAVPPGERAPSFKLRSFSGALVDLSSLRGKVVVIDFWASWCKPCKAELPVLERLSKKYASRGLVVIGVNVDDKLAAAKKFLRQQKLNLSFGVAHDADHEVAKSYAPPTMPSSYIVDRKGRVRFVHAGYRAPDAKKIEDEILSLLD